MAKSIIPFSFESHSIRAINKDGDIWFVASDICEVLTIQNSRDAVSQLDDDEKGVDITDTLGGKQKMTIINESGLYALVLRSRKPEAKKFRKWVTSEVLPSIRKTGGYSLTINTAQQGELATLIAERFPDGKSRPYAWSRFNNHFRLSSYKTLPAERFNEACEYIRTMPLTNKEQTAEKFLSNTQLLMTVDHNGKISLREISCIYDKLPELIEDPQHKGLSNKTILRIANACIKALAYREGHNLKAISSALSL